MISTGIATWTGTGNIVFFSGGVFENQNIFEIRNNELFDAGAGGGTFRNLGTTTKLESDGLTFFDRDMTVENPGTFNINTGQVEIKGGGISTGIFHLNPGTTLRFNTITPFVFDGGADFTGSGLLRLSGAPIVPTAGTNIDIENVEMVGGGFDNSGNLEIDNLTWPIFGGAFLGPGTTTVRVLNDMAGFTSRTISEQTFNTGPLTIWSDGAIRIKEEGHIINGGLFTAQDDANLIDFTNPDDGTLTNPLGSTMTIASASMTFDGGTNGGTVNNDGTMNFTGTSCRIQDGVAVNNTGLFHVVSGEVRLTNQTVYTQTDGTTRVDAGAVFRSTNITSFLGGTIEGNGTVRVSNPLVNEGATVMPGASAGELTIDGDYTQESAGTLQIEIGGLLPGEQHDVLDVTGMAVLGGTLELILLNGFVPEVGESFVIMTAGAMSGTFDEVNGPAEFEVNYGADHVTLTVRSVLKNRYVTFTPVEPGPVAYRVDMISSLFHPTAVVSGWVGVPDDNGIASLELDPVTRTWIEPVVSITGCEITPVAEFELSTSLDGGGSLLPPLALCTIFQPGEGKFWGDVVGFFDGEKWTAPQGFTNFDDAFSVLKSWQMADGAPELPRADVEPQELNRVVNFNDVFLIVLAFQADPYPFGCPNDPCQNNLIDPCL